MSDICGTVRTLAGIALTVLDTYSGAMSKAIGLFDHELEKHRSALDPEVYEEIRTRIIANFQIKAENWIDLYYDEWEREHREMLDELQLHGDRRKALFLYRRCEDPINRHGRSLEEIVRLYIDLDQESR